MTARNIPHQFDLQSAPKVSICVELDNFQYMKSYSTSSLFAALRREIASLADEYSFEIVLAINPSCCSISRSGVHEDLQSVWLGVAEHRILQVSGGYYEQKMRAAESASGNVLVFVDCDVVPDRDWLRSLLSPLEDESVLLVCGRTYVLPSGFFARLCSEIWLFDRYDEGFRGPTISRVSTFHANNFAVRRATFVRFCFPVFESFRGQCRAAAYDMDKAGIAMWRASAASVAHPAPDGVFEYFVRAFRRGSDLIATGRYLGVTGIGLIRHISGGIERSLLQPLARLRAAVRSRRLGTIGYIGACSLLFCSVFIYGLGCMWSYARKWRVFV
jgi:hypothetical protein